MICSHCRVDIDENTPYKIHVMEYGISVYTYHLCSSRCMEITLKGLNHAMQMLEENLKDAEERLCKRKADNAPLLGGDRKIIV